MTRYGSEYVQDASRNHIMYGGQGAWYYQGLAGISLSPGSIAFQNITFNPVTVCGNLSSVTASVVSHRGPIESTWECNNPTCDYVPENSIATVSCPSGNISAITFASFGTPVGSCANGFEINPACNNVDSVSVVSSLCLGQQSCSVLASDTVFGDPCYGTVKALAIQVACSGPDFSVYSHNITIPVGSVGSVHVPLTGATGTVTESGNTVWQNGDYVSGQTGFFGGYLGSDGRAVFDLGSGSYAFVSA